MKRSLLLFLALLFLLSACSTVANVSAPPEAASDAPIVSVAPQLSAVPSDEPDDTPASKPEPSALLEVQGDVSLAPSAEAPANTPKPSVTSSMPSEEPSPEPAAETVTVTVYGPEQELLSSVEVSAADCKNAFIALKTACAEIGLDLVYRGGDKSAYVVSINGYAEKSDGATSGWIYKVNGVQPSVGSSGKEVSAGDRVTFFFSRDMGKDVKDLD